MNEYLINGKTYRLNVFKKVDSKDQAYLLGYLLGDGSLNSATHKRLGRLSVGSADKYIIDHFKHTFCPDSKVDSRIPVNNQRKGIVSKIESHKLTFSTKFSPMFKQHGLLSLKRDRDVVNIPKKFMRSYIHGLVDADGCFSWGKRKDRDRLWGSFQITHQSLKAMAKVQKYLSEELNESSYISPRKSEDCIDLKMSNRQSVANVITWLYTDTPSVYNIDKEVKAKGFLKAYKTLHN